MLVEQLRICLKELTTLEKASLMDEARSTLNKLSPLKNTSEKRWRSRWLKRPVLSITSKPATKDWSTFLGNPRSSLRMQSKSLSLLGQPLPRHKP